MDALYIFLVLLSAFMCAAIFTTILVFALKYRRRARAEAEQIEGSTALEITWSVIPMFIFLFIFAWGAVIYFQERTPAERHRGLCCGQAMDVEAATSGRPARDRRCTFR